MRLNRNTIGLIVALLVVIALVLVLNNNQASAPGTSTVQPTSVPVLLLPGVDATSALRLEVRDNLTGQHTVLTKVNSDGTWVISDTGATTVGNNADSTQMAALMTLLTSLQTADTFVNDQLVDFGLDTPLHTVSVTTQAGTVYLLHVGAQSRVNPRYYVIVEQTTGEALATLEAAAPVSEATVEATSVVEVTAEAVAEAAAEATLELTAEVTPEATVEVIVPLPEPLVRLQGSYTIYLVQKTTIDRFIALITAPPVAVPTPVPTSNLPLLQVTGEATPGAGQVIPEVTPIPEAPLDATAEVTPEATVGS